MKETRISLPELGLVAGTRAALGLGLGLLLADRLTQDQRRAAGWALFLMGALSTIPLAFEVLGGTRLQMPKDEPEQNGNRLRSETGDRRQGVLAENMTPF